MMVPFRFLNGGCVVTLVWCFASSSPFVPAAARQWLSFVFLRSRGDAAFRSNDQSSSSIHPMERKTLLAPAEVPLEAQ